MVLGSACTHLESCSFTGEVMDKGLKLFLTRYPYCYSFWESPLFLVAASGKLPLYYTTVELAEGHWRIAVAALGIIFIGLSLFLILRPDSIRKVAYDVFLAYPMAALETKANFDKGRAHALAIAEALKTYAGVSTVYFAAQKIDSPEAFEAHEVAAEFDLAAIDEARYFVMVLPGKLASSVLFEAGYALARRKPSVYFVREKDYLPYLMKKVDSLPQDRFPRARVETYSNDEGLIQFVKSNKERLFPSRKRGA